MEGKVVFEGNTQTGKKIIIRYPQKEDLKDMWEYINELSKEKTFIRFQGESVSLEEEANFLNSQLDKIAKSLAVMLLVFCEGRLIGISGIEMKDKTEKHLGIFGISISKNFRGEGIGSQLMELVTTEAINNITGLEIIILEVFSNNDLAKQMYQNFGFLEYGKLPNGIKLEDGYKDRILMYKEVPLRGGIK